jgi:hypothetical protein
MLPWHSQLLTVPVDLSLVPLSYVMSGLMLALVYALWFAGRGTKDVFVSTIREAPVVCVVLVVLFVTSDVWELFGNVQGWRFASVLLVFVAPSLIIVTYTLVPLLEDIYRFLKSSELPLRVAETPARELAERIPLAPIRPELDRRQRWNIALALGGKVCFRVMMVAISTCFFFVSLGSLAVSRSLTTEWAGRGHEAQWHPHVLVHIPLGLYALDVTATLIRVSLVLAAIAALTFAITLAREKDAKKQYIQPECQHVKSLIAAWAYYTEARRDTPTESRS